MITAQQTAEKHGRRFSDEAQVQQRQNTPLPQEECSPSGLWLVLSVISSGGIIFCLGYLVRAFPLVAGISSVLIAVGVLIWFINRAFRGWDWTKW